MRRSGWVAWAVAATLAGCASEPDAAGASPGTSADAGSTSATSGGRPTAGAANSSDGGPTLLTVSATSSGSSGAAAPSSTSESATESATTLGSDTGQEPVMVDTATPGELPCRDAQLVFDPPFDPRGESPEDAFWMMWFAWRALLSRTPELEEELQSVGFDRFVAIDRPAAGLQAFVAARDDAVVVSFRGSEEILDWVTNLSFAQGDAASEGLAGNVHLGFRTSLDAGWAEIAATVDEFGGHDRLVWVTGQSLGGALAVLAAARMMDEGFLVAPLYRFANPRALDTQAASTLHARLGGRSYRYVNEGDVVPRLPPWGGAAEQAGPVIPLGGELATGWISDLDYMHGGQLHLFEDGAWSVRPPLDDSEDASYWAEISGAGWLGLLAFVSQGTEHDRDAYLCILRERAFGF